MSQRLYQEDDVVSGSFDCSYKYKQEEGELTLTNYHWTWIRRVFVGVIDQLHLEEEVEC